MAKLGSKQRPAFLRAKTQKRAEALLAMTLAEGFHAIVSVDPDQPEDYRDFQALLGRLQRERGIPEPRGMVPLPTYVPSAENEARSVHVSAASGLPLPPGHYTFLEYFCAEPGCDCRRARSGYERGPAAADLDELSEDRDRDLLGGLGPKVDARGRPEGRESLLREAILVA